MRYWFSAPRKKQIKMGGKMADEFSIYRQYRKDAETPVVYEAEHRIPVTYLCWGCGSSISRYEAIDLPIAVKELWNLCPRCMALIKRKNKGRKRGI